jgi:predicted lipase
MHLLIAFCLLIVASHQAYSSKVASQLAYMSDIAYESEASINAWNCSLCSAHKLTSVKVFSNTSSDIQGFTGYSATSNAIILSFRGSSNIKNWIINLSFNQVPYTKCTNCKVHGGFLSAYNGLKPIVISQLQNLIALYRTSTIFLTGHSLGGAIALLASTDIKDLLGNPTYFITFGEPRVGNT